MPLIFPIIYVSIYCDSYLLCIKTSLYWLSLILEQLESRMKQPFCYVFRALNLISTSILVGIKATEAYTFYNHQTVVCFPLSSYVIVLEKLKTFIRRDKIIYAHFN
jgi:hypothetical protein